MELMTLSDTPAPTLRMFAQEAWATELVHVSGRSRVWMDSTPRGNAYHCLPLAVANERGWSLHNPVTQRFTWNGDLGRDGVKVEATGDNVDRALGGSHFGSGIISFRVPFLFETDPGWTLAVGGPANADLPGLVTPLTGLVETSWAAVSLTMNWRFLSTGSVIFKEGSVFANIDLVPTQLPDARLEMCDFASWSRKTSFEQWSARRREHMRKLHSGETPAGRVWQREYATGVGDHHGLHRKSWRYREPETTEKNVDLPGAATDTRAHRE
jgi:hypothetical protein